MEETLQNHWICKKCGEKNFGKFCTQCGSSQETDAVEHDILKNISIGMTVLIAFIVLSLFVQKFDSIKNAIAVNTPAQSKQTNNKNQNKKVKEKVEPQKNNTAPQNNTQVNNKKNTTPSESAKKSNQQATANPWDIGKNSSQKEAIKALCDFHSNITNKNYRAAYNCLSQSFQDRMRYDGWAAGFKTTVSSTPLDIRVYSESADKVVLTYNLQAVDNPGGTSVFSGTTTVVKTQNGWKINEITNKLK